VYFVIAVAATAEVGSGARAQGRRPEGTSTQFIQPFKKAF